MRSLSDRPTTSLIVLAHPERRSFNGAWADASRAACELLGHRVLMSDLVAMGFDPVEKPSHYATGSGVFDPLKAQEGAAHGNGLPADVAAEVEKIEAADRIIFHFPMWWFGPPAVLKGWLDRVLAHGALHTEAERFDTGRLKGKAALFCVTTGATEAECGPDGKEGDVRMLLWPTAYALRYLGMDVLQPVTVHGVHGFHEGAAKAELEDRLRETLSRQPALIADFDRLPRLRFNADTDFDAEGRLRPGVPSHTAFIKNTSGDEA